MSDELNNLLAKFGMPPETQEQLVARKMREREVERHKNFKTELELMQQGGATKSSIMGTVLSRRLQSKRAREEDKQHILNTPEAKMAQLGDSIRAQHEKLMQTEAYQKASMQDKAIEFSKIAAQEAMKLNMPTIAARAAQGYVDAVRSNAKAELELEKLGATTESAQIKAREDRAKLPYLDLLAKESAEAVLLKNAKSRLDYMQTAVRDYWLEDGTQVAGIIQEDGSLMAGNTNVPMGAYFMADPTKLEGMTRDQLAREVRNFASSTTQESYRKELRNAMTFMEKSEKIFNLIDTHIKDGKDPSTFLGGAGAFNRFAADFARDIRGIVKSAGYAFNAQWDGPGKDPRVMNEAERSELVEEVLGGADRVDQLAHDLGAVPRAKFDSLIVQLAYAQARLQEPGNERLSDTDFKNALQAIGGNIRDPDAMKDVFLSNIEDHNKDLGNMLSAIPDKLKNPIFNDLDDRYLKRYEEFSDKWQGTKFRRRADTMEAKTQRAIDTLEGL